MRHLERLYKAAAKAGLLQRCVWRPSDGSPQQVHQVGFSSADETLMDGLTLSAEYAMTYPASALVGLSHRESVEIAGVVYLVREIRAVGDGSEYRAQLTRV